MEEAFENVVLTTLASVRGNGRRILSINAAGGLATITYEVNHERRKLQIMEGKLVDQYFLSSSRDPRGEEVTGADLPDRVASII